MVTTIGKVWEEALYLIEGTTKGEQRKALVQLTNADSYGEPLPIKNGKGMCLGYTQLCDCDDCNQDFTFYDKDNVVIPGVQYELDHTHGKIIFLNEYNNIASIEGRIEFSFINCSGMVMAWNIAVSEYITVVHNTELQRIDDPGGLGYATEINIEEPPFNGFFKIDSVFQNKDDVQAFPLMERGRSIFIKPKHREKGCSELGSSYGFQGVKYPFYIIGSLDIPKIATTYDAAKDIEFTIYENTLHRLRLLLHYFAIFGRMQAMQKSGAKDSFYNRRQLSQDLFSVQQRLGQDFSFSKKHIPVTLQFESSERPTKNYTNSFQE